MDMLPDRYGISVAFPEVALDLVFPWLGMWEFPALWTARQRFRARKDLQRNRFPALCDLLPANDRRGHPAIRLFVAAHFLRSAALGRSASLLA